MTARELDAAGRQKRKHFFHFCISPFRETLLKQPANLLKNFLARAVELGLRLVMLA